MHGKHKVGKGCDLVPQSLTKHRLVFKKKKKGVGEMAQ